MKKLLLSSLALLCISLTNYAQSVLPEEKKIEILARTTIGAVPDQIYYIPLRPYVAIDPNTGLPVISDEKLAESVAQANYLLRLNNSKLEFFTLPAITFTTPDLVNLDFLSTNLEKRYVQIKDLRDTNAHNLYFVKDIYNSTAAGFNPSLKNIAIEQYLTDLEDDFVKKNLIDNNSIYLESTHTSDVLSQTIVHEFAHFLNVHHTFESDLYGVEKADGSDCATAGDQICDIGAWPSDPAIASQIVVTVNPDGTCSHNGADLSDGFGTYTNLPVFNLMSYVNFRCRSQLSPEQIQRMWTRLNVLLANDVGYSFERTSLFETQLPPTLRTSLVGDFIQLDWNAQANIAYQIERKGPDDSQFLAIGGRLTSSSSGLFIDSSSFAANKIYEYRIKRLDTKTNYSNMSTIETELSYCKVRYFPTTCTENRSQIYNMSIDELGFSSTDRCDDASAGHTVYNDVLNLKVDSTYTMTIDLRSSPTSYTRQYYTIWLDYDKNGSFDASEMIYQLKNSDNFPYLNNFQFTIPQSTLPGDSRLRIMSANSIIGTPIEDPCSNYITNIGETEDYMVKFIQEDFTGVEQINLEQAINVYPNPTNDFVVVESPYKVLSYVVSDARGNAYNNLFIESLDATSSKIYFNNNTTGIYFINILTEEGNVMKKIIVE